MPLQGLIVLYIAGGFIHFFYQQYQNHTFIPSASTRTMASVGVLRCLAMSGELLTTLEAVDGFDAQVGTLSRWFNWVWLGLVGWAVRVCKRIRFIEGVKGFTHVGLVFVCCVLFVVCFVAPILYRGIVECGYIGELVERRCNGPPEEQSSTSLQLADLFSQFKSFKSLQKIHKNLRGALPMPTPPGKRA